MNTLTHLDVLAARERIAPYTSPTPLIEVPVLSKALGVDLHFKMECLQPVVRAFKIRGALNAVLQLSEEQKTRGIITHSSGNHGAALAHVGQLLGLEVHVVVPDNAPQIKIDNMTQLGAHLTTSGSTTKEREDTVASLIATHDYTFIHPYNDPTVIAGQGTAALEILEEQPSVEHILTPVGGGGLVSGTLLACATHPSVQVHGAEPLYANDTYRSLTTGVLQKNHRFDSIADGVRANLGPLPFSLIRDQIAAVYEVTEKEIIEATTELSTYLETPIEPSSALPYAALKNTPSTFAGTRATIIITGGNTL